MSKDISFKQEVIRGTLHSHTPEQIIMQDFREVGTITGLSCRVIGQLITDKVGGNFMLVVEPEETNNESNGSNGDMPNQIHGIDELIFRSFNLLPPSQPQELRLNL